MASNHRDDFFGGLFDFNGDGKTSLEEQFIAFKIFEEISRKSENTDASSTNCEYDEGFSPPTEYHFSEPQHSTAPLTSASPISTDHPRIPATKETYRYRRNNKIKTILITLLFCAILLIKPIKFLWALNSVYVPRNSTFGIGVMMFGG